VLLSSRTTRHVDASLRAPLLVRRKDDSGGRPYALWRLGAHLSELWRQDAHAQLHRWELRIAGLEACAWMLKEASNEKLCGCVFFVCFLTLLRFWCEPLCWQEVTSGWGGSMHAWWHAFRIAGALVAAERPRFRLEWSWTVDDSKFQLERTRKTVCLVNAVEIGRCGHACLLRTRIQGCYDVRFRLSVILWCQMWCVRISCMGDSDV
jgi:hypothetical protein